MKNRLFLATVVAMAGCVYAASAAHAICRVVEPAEDSGHSPVEFDPTTTALAVRVPDALLDYDCSHAGPPIELDPKLADDPRFCEDGSWATEVRGPVVSLVLRPALYARGGRAGLIMPLPGRADVQVAPEGIFEAVSELIVPGMVEETTEFIEDPSLGWQCGDPHYSYATAVEAVASAPLALYGCGDSGDGSFYRPGTDSRPSEVIDSEAGVVRVEHIPASPEYDIAVLEASSLDALYAWMDENGFAHGQEDDEALGRYVASGKWFLAVTVHPPDMGGERIALAPLVVSWQGREIPITHELQFDPRGGMLSTDLFVIGPHRMSAADGSATTEYAAPAYFAGSVLEGFGVASGWLTRLRIDRMMDRDIPDSRVVVAAAWEGEVRPGIRRTRRVYIAGPCCPDGSIPADEGTHRTHRVERSYAFGEEPADSELWFNSMAEPQYCGPAAYERYGAPDGYENYHCSTSRIRWSGVASWIPLLIGIGVVLVRARRGRGR
jgi:hypothetical protein